MARINLLPWREALRKQQQRDFLSLIGVSAIATAVIMFGVRLYINGNIDYQNSRNQYLQTEIAALEKKIKEIDQLEEKKTRLLAKMEIIQALQVSRPEIVHLFDEVAKTIPEGVFITNLEQKSKQVTFQGMAQSNARISTYMRNLEASPWVTDPVLNIIQSKGDKTQENQNSFNLVVKQATKKDEQDKNGGGV